MITFHYTFNDNSYAEFYQDMVKFWEGEGLPNYEGTIDGFTEKYPTQLQELLDKGIMTRTE